MLNYQRVYIHIYIYTHVLRHVVRKQFQLVHGYGKYCETILANQTLSLTDKWWFRIQWLSQNGGTYPGPEWNLPPKKLPKNAIAFVLSFSLALWHWFCNIHIWLFFVFYSGRHLDVEKWGSTRWSEAEAGCGWLEWPQMNVSRLE